VVCEPRGHDPVDGALLKPQLTSGAASGIIF
jgi:hypothetical protein